MIRLVKIGVPLSIAILVLFSSVTQALFLWLVERVGMAIRLAGWNTLFAILTSFLVFFIAKYVVVSLGAMMRRTETSREAGLRSGKPIEKVEHDLLVRDSFVARLSQRVRDTWRFGGGAIAVLGDWGSGKSSALNFLRLHFAADKKVEVVHFDPSLLSPNEPADIHILSVLSAAYLRQEKRILISHEGSRTLRKLAARRSSYLLRLTNLSISTPLGALELSEWPVDDSVSSLFERFTEVAESMPVQVLLIIDEIDRCDPEQVREILRTILMLRQVPNLCCLASFDMRAVRNALSELYDETIIDEYLDKVFLNLVHIPHVGHTQLRTMLDSIIVESAVKFLNFSGAAEAWLYLRDAILSIAKTPRAVIVFSREWLESVSVFAGELDEIDLAAAAILRTRVPRVWAHIATNPGRYTVGEGGESMTPIASFWSEVDEQLGSEESDSTRELRSLSGLSDGADDQWVFQVLQVLFIDTESGITREHETGRIKYINNLLLLLQGQAGVGAFSNLRVEEFFGNPEVAENVLRERIEDQTLGAWIMHVAEYVARKGFSSDHLPEIVSLLSRAAVEWSERYEADITKDVGRFIYTSFLLDRAQSTIQFILPVIVEPDASVGVAEPVVVAILRELSLWHGGVYKPSAYEPSSRMKVSESDALTMVRKWTENVEALAQSGRLVSEPNYWAVLFRWGQLDSYSKVQIHTELMMEQDLEEFARKFNAFSEGQSCSGIEKLFSNALAVESFVSKHKGREISDYSAEKVINYFQGGDQEF